MFWRIKKIASDFLNVFFLKIQIHPSYFDLTKNIFLKVVQIFMLHSPYKSG